MNTPYINEKKFEELEPIVNTFLTGTAPWTDTDSRRLELYQNLQYLCRCGIDAEKVLKFYILCFREKVVQDAIDTLTNVCDKANVSIDELRSVLDIVERGGYNIGEVIGMKISLSSDKKD